MNKIKSSLKFTKEKIIRKNESSSETREKTILQLNLILIVSIISFGAVVIYGIWKLLTFILN
jgi:hypothetical protein